MSKLSHYIVTVWLLNSTKTPDKSITPSVLSVPVARPVHTNVYVPDDSATESKVPPPAYVKFVNVRPVTVVFSHPVVYLATKEVAVGVPIVSALMSNTPSISFTSQDGICSNGFCSTCL